MKYPAYTLLEVLMATTVLALGLAAIFGILNSALKKSVDAAELADAQLACQTTLNELLARHNSIASFAPKDIPGLPHWKMSLHVYQAARPGMSVLHISAQKFSASDHIPHGILCQLLRWVPQNKVEQPRQDNAIDPLDGFEDPLQLPGDE